MILLPNTLRIALAFGVLSLFNSCGTAYSPSTAPSVIAPSYGLPSAGQGLSKSSISTATQTIVKTGSLKMKTSDARSVGEQIEQIITENGGSILNLNERDDKLQSASYSARVPAINLVSTMDQVAELGKVTYRRTTVADQTKEAIAQKARLNNLKQRKARLEALYLNAKLLKDKLDLEMTLSEIDEEIFSMEEAVRQMSKFSQYSKLNISLSQKSIRGPIGASLDALKWSWGKLFTIRE